MIQPEPVRKIAWIESRTSFEVIGTVPADTKPEDIDVLALQSSPITCRFEDGARLYVGHLLDYAMAMKLRGLLEGAAHPSVPLADGRCYCFGIDLVGK